MGRYKRNIHLSYDNTYAKDTALHMEDWFRDQCGTMTMDKDKPYALEYRQFSSPKKCVVTFNTKTKFQTATVLPDWNDSGQVFELS